MQIIIKPPRLAETNTLIGAMSSAPSFEREQQIDRLIRELKREGVWAKLDLFYVMAAHAEQAAQLNWVNPGSNTLVPANSPTFTTDRGYTGNGSNTTLDTGFNPATAGGKYSLDSAMNAAWVRNVITPGTVSVMGTGGSALIRPHSSSTQMSTRGNAATTNNGTTGDNVAGLHGWSRGASGSYSQYRNGSVVSSPSQASTAVTSATIHILSGGVASNVSEPTTHEVALACSGSNLTSAEFLALYSAALVYMTAAGAA